MVRSKIMAPARGSAMPGRCYDTPSDSCEPSVGPMRNQPPDQQQQETDGGRRPGGEFVLPSELASGVATPFGSV